MGHQKTAQKGNGELELTDDHLCACGLFGCFGFAKRWFCRAHVPPEFWRWPGSPHAATGAATVAQTSLKLPLMTGRIR